MRPCLRTALLDHHRRLATGLIVLLFVSLLHEPAYAQGSLLQAEHDVLAAYGETLTFEVSVQSPTTLSSARLEIAILNRATPLSIPVPISEGATISVSQTVTVGELQLPPAATLTYTWIFTDTAGLEYRTEPASSRYADNRVPWSWTTQQRGNLTVLTDGSDPQMAETVLGIAQNGVESTGRLLGAPLRDEVLIYVYPALAPMANSLRSHGLTVQDWVAAYAIPDQRTIFVAASEGPDFLPNLRQDLPHELMHLAVYAAAGTHTDQVPGWFNEGLALYAVPEPDPTLEDVLGSAVSDRVLLSLTPLCARNFAGLPPHDAALSYAQSASVVRYIADRYGTSQLTALMTAYSNGLGCSEGVELALGISLADLESQWIDYLSTTSRRGQRENVSMLPWIAAWVASMGLALLFISPQPPRIDERPVFDTLKSLPRVPSEEP